MNKRIIVLFVVLIAAFLVLWLFSNKRSSEQHDKPQPIAVAKNTSAFDHSFGLLLAAYYELKDALVESDAAKAGSASARLAAAADSLKTDDIKADSSGTIKETAKYFTGSISSSAQALEKEGDIEAKRKEFEIITESVWSLVRTVKYGGEKVYYQYCPMAFDDKGAYWLSNSSEIRNPYFGSKMLTCGVVEDSLDYSNQ